jgi:hypothetical protein
MAPARHAARKTLAAQSLYPLARYPLVWTGTPDLGCRSGSKLSTLQGGLARRGKSCLGYGGARSRPIVGRVGIARPWCRRGAGNARDACERPREMRRERDSAPRETSDGRALSSLAGVLPLESAGAAGGNAGNALIQQSGLDHGGFRQGKSSPSRPSFERVIQISSGSAFGSSRSTRLGALSRPAAPSASPSRAAPARPSGLPRR